MKQGTRLKPTRNGYSSVPQQISQEIMRHLSADKGKIITSKQLAMRLNYSPNYIKQIASEMVKSRMIQSSRRGYVLYELASD